MGRDKVWLDVLGRPALVRVVETAREVTPHVVVSASPGQELPPLPEGVERVDDPDDREHAGPLCGIASGLEALHSRGVRLAYVTACDSLFLNVDHIDSMFRALERDRRHPAVVPESGPFDDGSRFLHAMCGAVRVGVAAQTSRALLMSGQRAARLLYEGLNARRVAVPSLPEPRVVRSCNTPEEWTAAVEELAQSTP